MYTFLKGDSWIKLYIPNNANDAQMIKDNWSRICNNELMLRVFSHHLLLSLIFLKKNGCCFFIYVFLVTLTIVAFFSLVWKRNIKCIWICMPYPSIFINGVQSSCAQSIDVLAFIEAVQNPKTVCRVRQRGTWSSGAWNSPNHKNHFAVFYLSEQQRTVCRIMFSVLSTNCAWTSLDSKSLC